MKQTCDNITELMRDWRSCTSVGRSLRLGTDCVYPSFEQVFVVINQDDSEISVTDNGGAVNCVLNHGKTGQKFERILHEYAKKFGVEVRGDTLSLRLRDASWLASGVAAVANASASAARMGIATEEMTERERLAALMLESMGEIEQELFDVNKNVEILRNKPFKGSSGKSWKMDFIVPRKSKSVLIKSVSPNGVSINSNFVAFSDLSRLQRTVNFAVYSKSLEADDIRLLNEVCNVLPVHALSSRVKEELLS